MPCVNGAFRGQVTAAQERERERERQTDRQAEGHEDAHAAKQLPAL